MKFVITLLVVWVLAPLAYAQSAYVIAPGEDAAEELQEALILAEEGDVIELEAGVFHIKHGLSLDNSGVTLMGQGMGKSILSFTGQTGGAEGLLVTGNETILKDFAVENTSGDAIKAKGVDGIAMVRLRVEWTGGPKPENGAYGLYPVQSTNVYIEGCVAIGASDAGIYVGQSDKIITRNNRAEFNVAGLEIENSFNADVYDNVLTNNTGGILVFDLPDLPQQGGHHVRVFNNAVYSNHTDNFAPEGNIVGLVPRGTGMLIMANTDVEVFGNDFRNNDSLDIAIISYIEAVEDETYNPTPRRIHIHDNVFGESGGNPDPGEVGSLFMDALGTPMPHIVWDGVMPLMDFFVWGMDDEGIHSIHDNTYETGRPYGNANLIVYMAANFLHRSKYDLGKVDASYPSLPEVTVMIRGVDVNDQTF